MSEHDTERPGASGTSPKPSVLVLDDDPDILETLSTVFEGMGERSLTAQSVEALRRRGEEALGCKLAILDVNLGGESGIDAYQWLKQSGFRGRIVFLTGHAGTHPQVKEAVETGAQVLEKPTPFDELYGLMKSSPGP